MRDGQPRGKKQEQGWVRRRNEHMGNTKRVSEHNTGKKRLGLELEHDTIPPSVHECLLHRRRIFGLAVFDCVRVLFLSCFFFFSWPAGFFVFAAVILRRSLQTSVRSKKAETR
jgi:hypothetical protein